MSGIAVVGGGLAGAGAATLLARAGRRVTVLERETEPRDKICGEFLSGGAQRRLLALGLDPAALTDARIATLRVIAGARVAAAPLPFAALGLSRRRLDAALLDHAASAGARIERGVQVRAIEDAALRTTMGEITPAALLLASGKHDVRGARRRTAAADTGQTGLKTYWRLGKAAREALAGHIDIVLFPGGYAGLQLVENGVANLCATLRTDRLGALGGWAGVRDTLLAIPHVGRLLGDAEPLLARPIAISGVPYGFHHRPVPGERAFRLGDQAAVIPSFCGDGMAMALESAVRCAAAITAGASAERYHAALRPAFARQLGVARMVSRVVFGGAARPLVPALVATTPRLATWLASLTRVREAA